MPAKRPDCAVVIPSLRARVRLLLEDLSRQTVAPATIEVVRGVRPNGRARNEGVRRALAACPGVDLLAFIDDDARLLEDDALERVLAPLERDPSLVVSGAAKVLPPGATRFERRVAREVPRVTHAPVREDMESNPAVSGYGFSEVTTTCCAIRRSWLERAGGFREDISRGVDTELFFRLRREGARFVLAADARVAHGAPRDLASLLSRMAELGEGHAREAALEPSRRIGPRLESRTSALAYLALRALYLPANVIVPWSRAHPRLELDVRPLKALASFAAAVGYTRASLALARERTA
ncbi:glycosyltransferase family 2 protein [bacterium]|nr:glycosyltransferase family 2 protein [bacterium]